MSPKILCVLALLGSVLLALLVFVLLPVFLEDPKPVGDPLPEVDFSQFEGLDLGEQNERITVPSNGEGSLNIAYP
mgnify:CR=1 FL=1